MARYQSAAFNDHPFERLESNESRVRSHVSKPRAVTVAGGQPPPSERRPSGALVERGPIAWPQDRRSVADIDSFSRHIPRGACKPSRSETGGDRSPRAALSLQTAGTGLRSGDQYQISIIIAHFTAIPSPLARRGWRRSVGHHKPPAPCIRRGGERARDRGLRWGGSDRRRAQRGHAGRPLPPNNPIGPHIALRAAPTRRTASPHEMSDDYRDLV